MQYRYFPKIPNVRISTLGFGCMRLPLLDADPAHIDEDKSRKLLRDAIDSGVTYVDTAYPYHGGMSEPFVGRALKDGYREKVQLATKLPVWLVKEEADWERLLDEQLKKLDTDHIDFYLLHALDAARWNTITKLNGLKAMERAKADGRIRHLGFSFHDKLSSFKTIVDSYDWEFTQIQFNFIDTGYQAGIEGLEYAAARKIGVIAMEPLRGGSLAGKLPESVRTVWAKYPVSRTPADWALRWVWNRPEIVTLLSGMNTPAQLDENLALATSVQAGAMSEDELALVGEARAIYLSRTKVPCTACGYCQPCPSGVSISEVFSLYNGASMFDLKEGKTGWYFNGVIKGGHGADKCVECGACVPQCPQAISIIEKLKEAHAYLTAQ
jgi:uncharacterized protein